MRCATTWISRCIEHHPDLFIPAGQKELHFFDKFKQVKPAGELKRWNYEKGVDWYLSQFGQADDNQLIGEYTPNYFSDVESAELIHKHYPEVKLILSLRNPVDRLLSHYKYVKLNHKGIPLDPGAAIKEQNAEFQFLELGLYGKFLQGYLKHFSPDQILILLFDDIESNPHKMCKKLYSFLGVADSYIPPMISRKINSSNQVKSTSLLRVMRFIKQNIKKAIWFRGLIEFIGGVKVGRWINRHNKTENYAPNQKIDPETAAYLKDYYKDDILLLESLIGRDLSPWK